MDNDLTLVVESEGKWFVGSCREVPGANGQGKTESECQHNLLEAISLIFEEERRAD